MVSAALLCVLVAAPALALEQEGNPVSKVNTLLQDMITQLEKEGKEDEEVYEAMGCWCETNDKGKTKAIADAEVAIQELTSAIEGYGASSSRLNTEIANLEKEVAANTEALEKATAVRTKELAEFNSEEKESLQTISSLKGAIGALSKHHEASFLQIESGDRAMDLAESVTMLRHRMSKHADSLSGSFTLTQRKAFASFLEDPERYLKQGSSRGSVALLQMDSQQAPSGQIFGLMKQMKEEFESNLKSSQEEETKSQGDFEDLKAAKTSEIAAGEDQVETKTEEMADADEKKAQSSTLLKETRETLAADTKFLANLKEQCANVDAEYEQRVKTRQLEIQAVSKALAFLSSDDAKDLTARTLTLVQTGAEFSSSRRNVISQALARAAQDSGDPRLSMLASRARLDAFTEVKKDIQDMIDKLAKEQEDEVKHKDFCVDELNQNQKDTQAKEQEKNTLAEQIEDLAQTSAKMAKKIEELKATVADLQVQLKRAGEDREKENSEFQVTVADQRATQKLLAGALSILKGFYEKSALIQTGAATKKEPAGPPPPPGFKSYEKNAQSGGVMTMIQAIIDDAKAMEADALKAEEDAQKAFETFVADTNASIEAARKESVSSAEMKAKAEGEKTEREQEAEAVAEELETLSGENADLHKDCDYTLKNFDLRQGARQAEMEALKQALSMLSGAKFSAFLQQGHL